MPFLSLVECPPAFIRAELLRPAVCVRYDCRAAVWAEAFCAFRYKLIHICLHALHLPVAVKWHETPLHFAISGMKPIKKTAAEKASITALKKFQYCPQALILCGLLCIPVHFAAVSAVALYPSPANFADFHARGGAGLRGWGCRDSRSPSPRRYIHTSPARKYFSNDTRDAYPHARSSYHGSSCTKHASFHDPRRVSDPHGAEQYDPRP